MAAGDIVPVTGEWFEQTLESASPDLLREMAQRKACGCRSPQTGKQLGQKCPKLRRADGRWNSGHGSWYYQPELPSASDGKRRPPLRRGGFADNDAAQDQSHAATALLAIAGDDPASSNVSPT